MNKVKLWALAIVALLVLLFGTYLIPDIQAQGGVTGFSNLRVTNFYRSQPRAAITVTNGGTVDATGTYQQLTAAGAVAASLVVEPAGTHLYLVNIGSNTITFTETATLISAGNVALGAGDTAEFVSNGTAWYQVGASNN